MKASGRDDQKVTGVPANRTKSREYHPTGRVETHGDRPECFADYLIRLQVAKEEDVRASGRTAVMDPPVYTSDSVYTYPIDIHIPPSSLFALLQQI